MDTRFLVPPCLFLMIMIPIGIMYYGYQLESQDKFEPKGSWVFAVDLTEGTYVCTKGFDCQEDFDLRWAEINPPNLKVYTSDTHD